MQALFWILHFRVFLLVLLHAKNWAEQRALHANRAVFELTGFFLEEDLDGRVMEREAEEVLEAARDEIAAAETVLEVVPVLVWDCERSED